MENTLTITTNLQTACYQAFSEIESILQVGMSELAVANEIRFAMKQKGISEYWYDVPIFVLFGVDRFFDSAKNDYQVKSPHVDIYLKEGDPIYIDIHPVDQHTKVWGDWNSMLVFHPRRNLDDEQVAFLDEVRTIQRQGIEKIDASSSASEVATYYFHEFEKKGITLLDVRNNVGHSLHKGPKLPEKRTFLELGEDKMLGESIFTIEPGGFRKKKSGTGVVVGRFEEAIYIPKEGTARIIGIDTPLALEVINKS